VRYDPVLFDLDGTLIDSAEMILASLRHTTREVLGREFADDELRAGIGSPLVAHMTQLDRLRADELIRVYSEHNATLHDTLAACDGVVDVLRTLADEGRRLAVVTAKRTATVALAFERIPGLGSFFDVVVAAEDTARHKPHPEPLFLALDRLGARPREAAYVGDAPVDVQAANAAGVASIAVTWGRVHSAERLAREQADAIVATPEELLGVL
jgi:pyrophosphatase PpaX